eukprot:5337300-Amphidinium_carterae.1
MVITVRVVHHAQPELPLNSLIVRIETFAIVWCGKPPRGGSYNILKRLLGLVQVMVSSLAPEEKCIHHMCRDRKPRG